MTQEEKELLIKDLCARLPYGVKVCIKLPNHQEHIFEEQVGDLKELTRYGGYLVNSKGIDYRSFNLDIKPYLRPMSSMTDEEKKEINTLLDIIGGPSNETDEIVRIIDCSHECIELIDFYIKHHFDYRGLIPKGLALEATEGMYSIKTE